MGNTNKTEEFYSQNLRTANTHSATEGFQELLLPNSLEGVLFVKDR